MKRFALALVAVAVTAVAFSSARLFAEEEKKPEAPAAAPAGAPSQAVLDKVKKLLKLNGSEEIARITMDKSIEQIAAMPGLPAGFAAKFKEKADIKDLVALIVPIYAKHFDEATLDSLITFFESPVGKKLVAEQPAIAAESADAGAVWGAKVGAEVAAELASGK
jgi:hypothetical protein